MRWLRIGPYKVTINYNGIKPVSYFNVQTKPCSFSKLITTLSKMSSNAYQAIPDRTDTQLSSFRLPRYLQVIGSLGTIVVFTGIAIRSAPGRSLSTRMPHSLANGKVSPFSTINCTELLESDFCSNFTSIGVCSSCQGKEVSRFNTFASINCTEVSALPICESNPEFLICSRCNENKRVSINVTEAVQAPQAKIRCNGIEKLFCDTYPTQRACIMCGTRKSLRPNAFATINCEEVSKLPLCIKNPTLGVCSVCELAAPSERPAPSFSPSPSTSPSNSTESL